MNVPKIATNLPAFKYAGDYLQKVNIKFEYHPNAGIFELSCLEPDIIISNNYHESVAVSSQKPSIKIVGPRLQFPNYNFDLPPFLLDELSVLLANEQNNYIRPAIAYYNNGGVENHEFTCKLQSLGNTKILGNGFGPDEITKFVNPRMTPAFYKMASVCAASSVEEMFKIFFMGKPCITNFRYNKYCYHVDSINNIEDLVPFSEQANYAWQFSHTVILSKILELVNLNYYSEELSKIVRIERV